MRKFLYVGLIILFVLLGIEAVLFGLVRKLNRPPQKKETTDPSSLLFKSNEISFKTKDRVILRGWLIHGKPDCPAFIIAHDFGSNRADVLLKLERLVTSLNKKGYFIFLFDFRGHGESSSSSALGVKEDLDLKAAFQAVLKHRQIEKRIGVLGIGMGAIAALKASPDVDEVKFVALDSIYGNIPERHTTEMLEQFPFLNLLSRPLLAQAVDWNLRMKLNMSQVSPDLMKIIPTLYPRPILFVEHNPPNEYAKLLYAEAKEPKELIQLGETATGELTGDTRERYKDELEKKISKYLPTVVQSTTIELGK